MWVPLLFLSLVGFSLAAYVPTFPQQFYMKGVFTLPYFNLSEPIEMWHDGINNRQVISYYNGMGVTIVLQNTTYIIHPEIDTLVCDNSQQDFGFLASMFPDLSQWTLKNTTTTVNNILVDQWQLSFSNYSFNSTYDMYISTTGVPIQLHLFDSDICIMNYGLYLPNYVDESVFTVPTICENAKPAPAGFVGYTSRFFAALAKTEIFATKPTDELEIQFRQFIQKYNKEYTSITEYLQRFETYKQTLAFIENHNADETKTHKVGVNQFADMSDDEFRSKVSPKVNRPENNGAHWTHEHTGEKLPSSLDWRQLGAVTPVKDQGFCGSCYTFGSTGSLEGAYQIKYGNLISLSEQQILDCGWTNGTLYVQGCYGGFAAAVYQYIIDNGGIASESQYPYLMRDGWCHADISSGVVVKAYVNVTGEDNLLSAVALNPVDVAIDASHPEFRYYSSGVYYQPDCGNTLDDLDHEVVAVGYGTHNGQDYWLVKNSWSIHWGDEGYVMMSRNRNNNCGIATQATYPVVA